MYGAMRNSIAAILRESAELKNKVASDAQLISEIDRAAQKMLAVIRADGTIYSCGNGGSTCDAMHLTEELVARYKRARPGIRAMHFADAGTITCWSNDYEFESAFERQAQTFCTKNDFFVGISTSGNSKNVLRAIKAAKAKGTFCVGLLGRDGGTIRPECDVAIVIPEKLTERIQELHITIIHIWMELVEVALAK